MKRKKKDGITLASCKFQNYIQWISGSPFLDHSQSPSCFMVSWALQGYES